MSPLEQIALKVKELGFTVYEAKTYVALLQNSPVTRYELSKNSGVPRSAIYGVIQQLENIGAVNVSIQNLKGEEGSKVAEKLLDILKIGAKINEIKKDYTSRFLEDAIVIMRLKDVLQ